MPHYFGRFPQAILHIDADAFFASCEQALHPEYRGKVVITGKERGIVSAVSYEGKRLGISRAMSLWDVKKLCPDAIIVPSDYESYSLFSKRMFEVIRRYTSIVEEYSIDEAFADITGLRRPLKDSYEGIALRIKREIEADLGITVSVGLSLSKVLAKVGSKHNKPAGLTPIPGEAIEKFLAGLAVEKVWGIGARTTAYCAQFGITTALQFAKQTEAQVNERYTKPHVELWRELNGESVLPVITAEPAPQHTIGKTRTFTPPSRDRAYVFSQLLKNVENACIKARRHKQMATGASFFLKTQEHRYVGLETKFTRATAYPSDIVDIIRGCFDELFAPRTDYRATGVVLFGLQPADTTQLSLFESPLKLEKMRRIYSAVDDLAAKYGKHAVHLSASSAANKTQHLSERGDIPTRKLNRLKGETRRVHLTLPVLQAPSHLAASSRPVHPNRQ